MNRMLTVEYCRRKAEQCRRLANSCTDRQVRHTLTELAKDYEALLTEGAEMAEGAPGPARPRRED